MSLPRNSELRVNESARKMQATDLMAFSDAWNRHDEDAIMTIFTKDCVFLRGLGRAFRRQKKGQRRRSRVF